MLKQERTYRTITLTDVYLENKRMIKRGRQKAEQAKVVSLTTSKQKNILRFLRRFVKEMNILFFG